MDIFIGIIWSTSGIRAIATDERGILLASGARSIPAQFPGPGQAQLDARRGAQATIDVLAQLMKSGLQPQNIRCIAVGSMGGAALLVNETGTPAAPMLLWMDMRHEGTSRDKPEGIDATSKLLWLAKRTPKASCFLQPNGYLTGLLTGTWTLDLSQGHAYRFFAPSKPGWNIESVRAFDLDPKLLPPLRASYDIAGGVTASIAAQTGLPEGTPVVCGGNDMALGLLGCGAEGGHALEASGQSGGLSIFVDERFHVESYATGCAIQPGAFVLHGGTTAGSALYWLGDNMNDSMTSLIREAESLPAGSGGLMFLPHMAGIRGRHWDQTAKGAFVGLTYDKSPAHLTRAVLEGVAYSIQDALQNAMEAGVQPSTLHVSGGSARVDLWSQMKADVTGRSVCIYELDDAQLTGAVVLAAVGVRRYATFQEAQRAMVRKRKIFTPSSEHRKYRYYLALYQGLTQQLRPTYEKLEKYTADLSH